MKALPLHKPVNQTTSLAQFAYKCISNCTVIVYSNAFEYYYVSALNYEHCMF